MATGRGTGMLLWAAAAVLAQTPEDWALVNLAERLEVEVHNPAAGPVRTLAVIPVREAAQVALRFPGSLAIAVIPGARPEPVPSQADDLDADGNPDEFVFPVELAAGQTRIFHIYYSTTLRDAIPYPKRVHASHAFGYNRATVTLESEPVGYRTYGGFFLDIQARWPGKAGLFNSLVGYFGSGRPSGAGLDVIHLGDTLGLGGFFLRTGGQVYRPPLNMPDYAHKPEPPGAPVYRVIATGPVRAVVEARLDSWRIGADRVSVRALYSIAAEGRHVDCRLTVNPLEMASAYEVGAGIRHLPDLKTGHAPGRLALTGQQNARTGPLGLALYYDEAAAAPAPPLRTREEANECVVFRAALAPGRAFEARYAAAGVWSGSGVDNLLGYLAAVDAEARAHVRVGGYRRAATPLPQRVNGEAD